MRLLVSDIDGTLLEGGRPTEGLAVLRRVLAVHTEKVALVYATGRSFSSTWSLVEDGVLPVPDAVAPFVGTEMWFPGWSGPERRYRETLMEGWDRAGAMEVIGDLNGVRLQAEEFQSELKASFEISSGTTVMELEALLSARGIRARVVYSCGRYLDVLPERAGKGNAVDYVRRAFGAATGDVLTCGDSGNDLDMLLDPRTRGVAVGNSEAELAAVPSGGSFYKAFLPFASGVLEGAAAFRFWPSAA